MANINFNDLKPSTNESKRVSFFKIGNGEEAIVRIMIDSVDDFDLKAVHPITVGASSFPNRKVNCLIDNPHTDPLEKCPLCARGEKLEQRIYIPMIQYTSENGRIVANPVVWDRPAYSFATLLKGYLDNYGPLSNIMCKITRTKTGQRAVDVQYNILPNLNPQMYNEQTYSKVPDAFDNFKVLGTMVMDKTADEINQFIMTGSFPQRESTNAQVENSPSPQQTYSTMANPNQLGTDDFPNFTPPTGNEVPVTGDFKPSSAVYSPNNATVNSNFGATPTMDRPTRYYE